MAYSKNRRLAEIISDTSGNLAVQGITVPTQSSSDNDTSAASTAYVTTAVSGLIDSAPDTLNTLNEIAAALNDDADFNTTVTNSIAAKLPLSGGTLTGALTTNGVINTGTSHNFAINTPNSLRINIDSNNSATDQVFCIGHNRTDVGVSNDVLMMMNENGNMAIGHGAPSHRLHIQGDTNDNARVRVTNTADGQASLDLSNSEGYFRTFTDAGEYRIYDQTDGAFRMRIDTSGQVAIGSHSPLRTLHVNSGGTNVVARLESTDGIAAVEFKDSAGSAEVGCNGNDVVFFPAGAEKARLTSGGNLGIGTLSSSGTENLIHAKGTNNSAGDLGTAVGPGNIPAIQIQNAGTTDNNMAAIFFMDDASVRAGVHARFTSHSSDDAELRLSTSDGGNLRERMIIHKDGDVSIGTNMNAYTFAKKLIVGDGNDNDGITIQSGSTHQGNIAFANANGTTAHGRISYQHNSNYMSFLVNNDEKVRLNTNGTLYVTPDLGAHSNVTSFAHSTYAHAAVFGVNSTPDGTVVIEDYDVSSGIGNTVLKCYLRDQDPATSATFIDFSDGGGRVGSITHNDDGGGVTYNTTSDYRLKENVNYTWDALPLLNQLKPAKFNFIRAPEKTVQGMLAHEVMDIVPHSVRGDKDHMEPIGNVLDSSGNIVHEGVYEHFAKADQGHTWEQTGTEPLYQELDYSRLVPLLTKAIQEQQTIIDNLKSRIETLEG